MKNKNYILICEQLKDDSFTKETSWGQEEIKAPARKIDELSDNNIKQANDIAKESRPDNEKPEKFVDKKITLQDLENNTKIK